MPKPLAQEWAYTQLDAKYPPLPEGEKVRKTRGKSAKNTGADEVGAGESQGENQGNEGKSVGKGRKGDAPKPTKRTASQSAQQPESVIGLSRIPADWPPLPPNSSLAAEIQWVQSVRIDVVQELPTGGVVVHLHKADRPAPSKAALGWLETSIRAYAKYCDIAAKAASTYEDEREVVRRERMSIEQVRALLSEVLEADGPAGPAGPAGPDGL
jgi:hypothetical protein